MLPSAPTVAAVRPHVRFGASRLAMGAPTDPSPTLSRAAAPRGRYGRSVHGAIERLLESMALPLLCAPPGTAHATAAVVAPPDGQTPFERLRVVEAALAGGEREPATHPPVASASHGEVRSRAPPRRVLQDEARQSLRHVLEAAPAAPTGGVAAEDGSLRVPAGYQGERVDSGTSHVGPHDVWAWEECARLVAQLDHLEAAGTRKAHPWNAV